MPKPSKTLLPEDFSISPTMRQWARMKVPSIDIDGQHEEFCDYWRAHGKMMADWQAAWRNWMRRAPQFSKRAYGVSEPRAAAREAPAIAPPVQVRDHPLFRQFKN